MPAVAPLSEQEIKQFAMDWYRKLDVHAPMVQLLPMLAGEELEMRFPDASVRGHAGFEEWYQRVIRVFFDEVHTVKEVTVTSLGDRADVKVVVNWEGSVWRPPAAKSERIVLDAFQTWVVARSPQTGKLIIVTYIVDSMDYHEGSARL
jgi:hypothetical protein